MDRSIHTYMHGRYISWELEGLFEGFYHGCPQSDNKYCLNVSMRKINLYERYGCDYFECINSRYIMRFDICELLKFGHWHPSFDHVILMPFSDIPYIYDNKTDNNNSNKYSRNPSLFD